MNRLLEILQSKYASVFCLIFAIGNRIIFTSFYSLIGTDTKIQLTLAQNLMAGKGMGVTKYFTNNLSVPIFDTQQFYPPGLSLTIIPFLKLFSGDEDTAILVFDIIVAIFFIVVIRKLGKKIGLSPALNNVITLIAGCVQYIFFMAWSSTDAISLCFVLGAVIKTIDLINKKQNISLLHATGCGLLFCLPFFFRYMYLPIAMLLPGFILIAGFLLKNKMLKAGGLKLLAASAFFLTLLFLFSIYASGNALFVQDFGRGIFFDQLTTWYPFLPASFISLDFAAQLTEKFLRITYSRAMLFAEIVNPILFVLLLILLWRYCGNYKKKQELSNHFLFITIGSSIGITIILLLAYLTLTYKAIPWGNIRWTHSQHARYFAFIYVFVPLLMFAGIQHYAAALKRSFVRFFVFIGLVCLIIESLHGVYYNVKILLVHKDLAIIRDADKGYSNFQNIIEEIKKQHPGEEVLICSPDQYYLYAASQMGYKAIFDYKNLWQSEFKVSSKSILLMPVHEQEAIIMHDYIEKKKPIVFTTIAGTYFYTEEINP